MAIGRFIADPPQHGPNQAERTSHYEGRFPPPCQDAKYDDRRGRDRSNAGAHLESASGERALPRRKPFRYRLCARGNGRCFGRAEHPSENGKTLPSGCETMRHFGERPADREQEEAEPRAEPQGVRVWREPLVWVAPDQEAVDGNEVIQLVVLPEPCVYRKRATDALDASGRTWRIAYTSTSFAGAQAAVKAGLGISVLPRKMVSSFLVPVATAQWLPKLPDTEIALIEGHSVSDTGHLLAQHIVQALEPITH